MKEFHAYVEIPFFLVPISDSLILFWKCKQFWGESVQSMQHWFVCLCFPDCKHSKLCLDLFFMLYASQLAWPHGSCVRCDGLCELAFTSGHDFSVVLSEVLLIKVWQCSDLSFFFSLLILLLKWSLIPCWLAHALFFTFYEFLLFALNPLQYFSFSIFVCVKSYLHLSVSSMEVNLNDKQSFVYWCSWKIISSLDT